ncbi:HpcH/HpaI aldolase family protein [Halorussus lipolyticus]|uniref:HpcH/HpaI aldolase family protein n=1 Tax=Halorussus lipolyticus TaxID=3034024 RepID=UPI0023E7593B|nr:aldolase/citrate lyase family protein [Halorussus sp. DT80]
MTIPEQRNRLADLRATDEVYLGAGVETASERLIEVYGKLGLDWVWVDLEHKNGSPLDAPDLERLVRSAQCGGTELVVRLPNGEPSTIRKVLDTGVRNVVVPRVETAGEVERAVRAARFEYDGEPGDRGLSQGRASGYGAAFGGDRPYHEVEDENVQVGVLVENRTAVENVEEIAAVPELGFVFPGPGDLGVSMGRTHEYDDPEVRALVERVRETCVEHGVPLLGFQNSNFAGPEEVREATDRGYRLVSLGDEFTFVAEAVEERIGWVDESGGP